MHHWIDFAAEAPEIAEAGQKLLYQFGLGLGFLATIRADGAPRLHPICPVLHEGGLYALIGPNPKQKDLLRDGRYALHSFPPPKGDHEFYLNGRVVRADALESAVRANFVASGGTSSNDEVCFELLLGSAMLSLHSDPPKWSPVYSTWRSSRL